MRYFITIAGREMEVDLTGPHPVVDGTPVEAQLSHLPGTQTRHLLLDGRSYTLAAAPSERRGRWSIGIGAERFTADAVDERTRAIRAMTGAGDDVADKTWQLLDAWPVLAGLLARRWLPAHFNVGVFLRV